MAHMEAILFSVLGPALVLGDAWWLRWTIRFHRTALRASGVVIASDKSAGRYGTQSSPRFRFQTPDGRDWEVESLISTRPAVFRAGETVTVLYRSEKPQKAYLDSISQLWLAPIVGLVIGMIFCVLAWVTWHSAGGR